MERPSTYAFRAKVDVLFAAALELDAPDRARFLEREGAGRAQLRREVEALLDASAAAEACFGRVPEAIGAMLAECISTRADAGGDDAEPIGRRIGRYRIVRQVARGGMGTVYLAERADGAFERRVALKLLRRGLDTDDILVRFRAERQILADLEHPNIARLIDGGSTADGRPFLVMEYVSGLPITTYCEGGDLDLKGRLRLFIDTADAVHHAHTHGVIHRDLKPANILVEAGGRVKLLDFGIARLLSSDGEGGRTGPGVRLMTPKYASPEQVRGDDVGVASDVYQLGLLLYELLTGAPMHQVEGRSITGLQRVAGREAVLVPSTRALEGPGRHLRGDLASIVLQALRENPAHRYPSAEELAHDVGRYLEHRPVSARSGTRGYRLRHLAWRHRVKLAVAAGVVTTLSVAGALSELGREAAVVTEPGSIAVLPFRVSGADASLGYLRQGMVDLLSAKLTGEGGLRSVAPATVLNAWQQAGGSPTRDVAEPVTLDLARGLGAEYLLIGEVVGPPSRMIVNASLLRLPEGGVAARATVQAPADSLLSVVDELTARLLVLRAGEWRPMGALATTSLPALRGYLDGWVDFRSGRYDDAYDRFTGALELDSTFALAAVRAWQAAWFSRRRGNERLLHIAWQGRDGLGDHDLAFVEAILGPSYPAPYSDADRLSARRRLVDMAPDQVEFRYMYADRLYHWHALLALVDGAERAAAQFRRALEADSSYAPTYQHLVPLLYALGHTREAEHTFRAYLRREPGGAASFLAWRSAAARGDTTTLESLRAGFETLSDGELLRIYAGAVGDGVEVEDAERVMSILRQRGLTPSVRGRVLREDFILQMLRGRPTAAIAAAERLREAQSDGSDFPRLEVTNSLVLSALYGDGAADAAGRALARLSASAFDPGGVPRADARVPDLCTVSQWRLWHGESRGVGAAVEVLRNADTSGEMKDTGPVCAMLLEAIESTLRQRPDAADRLARLDSALVTGPHISLATLKIPASIAAAGLHERNGDPDRALAAVRRRVYDMDSSSLLLATSLRMAGRLAASQGDAEDAARAYRHYLALRSDPEPALQAQVDSVRAELAALE